MSVNVSNGHPPSILIVDDDRDVRMTLAEILRSEGYQVSTAQDGDAAVEQVVARPDLILTDLRMPGRDGIELLRHVLDLQLDTGVVLLSGNGDLQTAVTAMRMGASDFLTKPINPPDLIVRLERALERRQLLTESRQHRQNLESTVSRQQESLSLALAELQHTYEATLEALARALDLRDKETEGHSRRVTEYTTAISRRLGLDGDQLETIRQGALLHDLGKIGIPDAVLHKAGPLNDEEWALMTQHPQIGYDLLKDIEFLHEAVASIVLRHQERYDGAGYPGGLLKGEIPLGARIFAVADTLDAITSDRVYRAGRPLALAREEIQRHSGTQFDPQVVEAFMSIPDQNWHAIRTSVAVLYS